MKILVHYILDKKIELSEVIFGDVWLCSGQSNMEMKMWAITNATEELKMSAEFDIRFTVLSNQYSFEQDDFMDPIIEVQWSDASQEDMLG